MAELYGLGRPIYFAVAENFPVERLADEMRCGILIADGFDMHILREAPLRKLRTHVALNLSGGLPLQQ